MRSFFVIALLGVMLLTAALVTRSGILARENPGQPINSAMREALAKSRPMLSTADAQYLAAHFATAHETNSGMRYVVRHPGEGDAKPRPGQTATVHYEGRLLDGTVFDSTIARGQGPLTFVVGTGRVIAGWDEAIQNMRKGEKRTLVIPYWLAYGDKGVRGTIPARATLIFEVELVDFQ